MIIVISIAIMKWELLSLNSNVHGYVQLIRKNVKLVFQ